MFHVSVTSEAAALLGGVICKGLSDKNYEKRKNAALEIEQQVKLLKNQPNFEEKVAKIIEVLNREFIDNSIPNYRKGGLIALASIAIGLMHESIGEHLDDLINSVLKCFSDQESRVRYYACESLYNIVKVSGSQSLRYFNEIFDGLCKLFADVDSEVKHGAQFLDRLIKDIATESKDFSVASFVSILSQRISVLNPFIRQLMLSWIMVLDSVPDVNLIEYLPDFLDGLFNMLADTNRDIRHGADACLSEFLNEIKDAKPEEASRVMSSVSKVLMQNCRSSENFCRLTALVWLHEFVELQSQLTPQSLYPEFLDGILHCISDNEEEISRIAYETHNQLLIAAYKSDLGFSVEDLVNVLLNKLQESEGVSLRIACLQWICMLLASRPSQTLGVVERLFDVIFFTLKHSDSEVVITALQVLSLISKEEKNFQIASQKLLQFFSQNRKLLEERGRLIIRQLCNYLDVKKLYTTLADAIQHENDLEYCHQLVQTLNWILLTSNETKDFRECLRNRVESQDLFERLLIPWFHNPVSTLALCLWVEEYEIAYQLTYRLGLTECTLSLLLEVDQLIHLLECPVFAKMRIHLLNPKHYHTLLKTIMGICMLMPQNEGYKILKSRLQIVQTAILAENVQDRFFEQNQSTLHKQIDFIDCSEIKSNTVHRNTVNIVEKSNDKSEQKSSSRSYNDHKCSDIIFDTEMGINDDYDHVDTKNTVFNDFNYNIFSSSNRSTRYKLDISKIFKKFDEVALRHKNYINHEADKKGLELTKILNLNKNFQK